MTQDGPGAQPRTILIADGDDRVRQPLADFLRECGYTVVEATSTDEAWSMLNDAAGSVDVVLCDFALSGGGSALDLAIWARKERSGLSFILTGNVESEAMAAAELCDEGAHLGRPYELKKVLERIRDVLALTGGT